MYGKAIVISSVETTSGMLCTTLRFSLTANCVLTMLHLFATTLHVRRGPPRALWFGVEPWTVVADMLLSSRSLGVRPVADLKGPTRVGVKRMKSKRDQK